MSAPGLKITNFHYSNMVMPEVEHSEYPKWVHMTGYPDQLAVDAEQEAELLRRPPKEKPVEKLADVKPEPVSAPEPKQTLTGPNDEREILLQIAEEKNIRVDKRWGIGRLRATIERETSHL